MQRFAAKAFVTFTSVLLLAYFTQASPDVLGQALQLLQRSHDAYLDELAELVAFPTVSALPEHETDIRKAAQWLVSRLERAGLEAATYETEGPQPAVIGQWLGAPAGPTVLVYGHYDVQPVDPLGEWRTEPFKLSVGEDGYMYGRGVDDDKGPLLMAVQAVEALLQASTSSGGSPSLPINIKFLLEGQEEVMSPNLGAFLLKHKDLLAADLCLSADGRQASDTQGAVLLGLRGIVSMQVEVVTAATDMHSGLKGGSVPNANHVLAGLLAGLRDTGSGRVLVAGFYDGVGEMTEGDRADAARFAAAGGLFDDAKEAGVLGLSGYHGEAGFNTLERRWHRPTLEVVGMQGGFTGDGIKTVIPRTAFAKLSSRLVPGQDPASVFQRIKEHLAQAAPSYANVSVTQLGGGSVAWTSPRGTLGNRVAAKVLEVVMGSPPLYQRDGGTIPALAALQSALNVPTTVFAWGLGDNIHAPNERLKASMLTKGREAWARLLWELGQEFYGTAVPAGDVLLTGGGEKDAAHDEL